MSSQRSTAREYLEALLIAGVFLGFTNTFLVKTFYIPSASMEETLLVGDHLFVNRFIYGANSDPLSDRLLPHRGIKRGDIVIFRSPERPTIDMVKRCIGLPGDKIQLVDKELYVNGDWVNDSAATVHRDPRIYPDRRDNFGPFTVPEGNYFCMGDNRDNSNDSRFWGPVPAHFVKGRALLIYWSFGGQTSDGQWRGWGHKIRQLVNTAVGFVTQTRWNRTLQIIR